MNMQSLSSKNRSYRAWAAIASLVFGAIIMLIKFRAHNLTGSQGVYSDALESIVNVLTAAMALFVVQYAAKPADVDHPYGHGKIEYFSSAFEGGLITLAAFFIFFEAGQAYLKGYQLQNIDQGVNYVILAGVMNLILSLSLIAVGRSTQSVALKASGLHILSDVWTSGGVLLGLYGVKYTGIQNLDILAAILVGCYLAWTGLGLVRESIGGLLDEEDLGILEDLAKVFGNNVSDGIIQIHHTKVIRSGWFHHIDAHVVVPEFWTINEAHEALNEFEQAVISDYAYQGEMNFHLDPCRKNYCTVCSYPNCAIRANKFESRMPVLLEHLRSKNEPDEFSESNKS